MRINVTYQSNYVVDAVMGALRPESRAEVYSVAGRAVMNHVQRHIRAYMRTKHGSAHALGARPTGHYEKGAAAITTLTLPRAAVAYGRTVAEVRALGWTVFKPKGTNWLMGTKGGDRETLTLLYTLVGGVVQRRDPSLLPPQGEIAATGWNAIWKHIQKAVAKARQGGLK